ncbi:MAG: PDZ domain-containing protein, partial [Chthoniobacteraceae bacterium]
MKPNILNRTIAALLLALPIARADDKKAEEKNGDRKSGTTHSSSTVISSADGTATITIDVNGKKETRTFKLGDGNSTFSFGKDGDGAKAAGAVGAGGSFRFAPGHAKTEKGPWIGIAMEPLQEAVRAQFPLAPGEGVVVSHVVPDNPAAKAGLEANDILLRFDDQILVEPSQLQKLIAMKKPGDSVKLTYMRKGERKETSVTLIEHELQPDGPERVPFVRRLPLLQDWQKDQPPMPEELRKRVEEQFKQLKEKHPGVIVDKQMWFSGTPGDMLKGQIEKMLRSLEESNLPKDEVEHVRKELEHAKREADEAIERAKRSSEEAIERARRAVDEASETLNNARKPQEKEKGGKP